MILNNKRRRNSQARLRRLTQGSIESDDMEELHAKYGDGTKDGITSSRITGGKGTCFFFIKNQAYYAYF